MSTERTGHGDTGHGSGRALVLRDASDSGGADTAEALRARVQELEAYIDARRGEWQRLNAKIGEYKDALKGMQHALKTSDATVIEQELGDRILGLERRCAELAGRLQERETRCGELQERLDDRRGDREQLRSELLEARSEIQRLESALAGRESDSEERSRLDDEHARLVEELTAERDEARAQLGEAALRIEEAERRCDEGWSETERLRSEIAAQAELIVELEEELNVKQQMLDMVGAGIGQADESSAAALHALEPVAELLAADALTASGIVDVGEPTGGYARSSEPCQPIAALEAPDGTTYAIEKPSATIGRSSKNDVCIRKDFVSRTHARLTIRPIGATIEDAGSTNGLWINSKRVQQGVLRHGDVVCFGSSELEFRFVDLS